MGSVTRDWLLDQLHKHLFNPVCVGVDIGKLHDPTAIAVAEVSQKDTGKLRYGSNPQPARYIAETETWIPAQDMHPIMTTEYTIRHIKRLPLGMSYPKVALHLADMICSPLFAGRDVRVLLDVTGVGRPVYDSLYQEILLRKSGIWYEDGSLRTESKGEMKSLILKPITFAHGEKYNRSTGNLGKAFLVSRLQSLLQNEQVHGPNTAEMLATIQELKVYEIKVDQNGKDTYGATGLKHDDLATALGLSCLEDPFADSVSYSKRVY